MKKIGFAISVAALLAVGALQTFAQGGNPFYGPVTVANSDNMTNDKWTSGLGTTNTIQCASAENIGVQVALQMTAAGTTNLAVVLDTSLDGSNWDTGWTTINTAGNGTTAVVVATNTALGSFPYVRIRCTSAAAADTVAFTNTTVKVYVK